jgi:kynurenine formamidase
MRIIDLSVTLRQDEISLVPGHPNFELEDFHFHERDFRSNSFLRMSTHTGTHVDAPYHFIEAGLTIDQLPLDTLVGRATLIDLRKVSAPRKGITLEELQQALGDRELSGRIAILHSGWITENWSTGKMYGESPFLLREGAEWLVQKGIRSLGLDFLLDDPEQDGLPLEKRFPIHRIFLGHGIPHIENLCHLERIDREEFFFVALPLKLYKCNGAPARAIAILDG